MRKFSYSDWVLLVCGAISFFVGEYIWGALLIIFAIPMVRDRLHKFWRRHAPVDYAFPDRYALLFHFLSWVGAWIYLAESLIEIISLYMYHTGWMMTWLAWVMNYETDIHMKLSKDGLLEKSGRSRLPVTEEITGSNPVQPANNS